MRFFSKFPSQTEPSAQMNFPVPCLQPQKCSPSQEEPSFHFQMPYPCCRSSDHCPLQLDPSVLVYIPKPCALSFFHSPSQTSPFAWMSLPLPLAWSSTQNPSQSVQSSHTCFPLPLRMPLLNWPIYLAPFSILIGPLVICGGRSSSLHLNDPSWIAIFLVVSLQKSSGCRLQSSLGSNTSVSLPQCSIVWHVQH